MRIIIIVVYVSVLVLFISGCSAGEVSDEKVEYVYHKIEVFAAKDNGANTRIKADEPIFTESDIHRAEYEDNDVDIDIVKIFFADEYLSHFDTNAVIEEYESELRIEGLRIYSEPRWDMFEIYIDDEFLFAGRFPNGMLSSILYVGPWLSHEVDGVTLCLNMGNEDLYGIDEKDREVLRKALIDMSLLY